MDMNPIDDASSGLQVDRSPLTRGSAVLLRVPLWAWTGPILTLALVTVVIYATRTYIASLGRDDQDINANIILTERLEITDGNGKVAVLLSGEPDGSSRLSFRDHDGDTRLEVGVDGAGAPSILLLGKNKSVRIAMSLSANDALPTMKFYDDTGGQAISLAIDKDSSVGLQVGRSDRNHISAGVAKNGDASIRLVDGNMTDRIALAVINNLPAISLLDENRVSRASMAVKRDGTVSIRFSDAKAKDRLIAGVDAAGHPHIQFIGSDQKISRELTADHD